MLFENKMKPYKKSINLQKIDLENQVSKFLLKQLVWKEYLHR